MSEALEFVKQEKIKIINKLQDEYLDFKLDPTQVEAILQILDVIAGSDDEWVTLSGSAGSGKTAIVKLIVRYLEQSNIPYLLATPTNKACGVLSKVTQRNTITLHKLLSLKPTINILELDFKDLKFSSSSFSSGIPNNGVLIVDECSMINRELFKFIIDQSEKQNCKVLFFGDALQLYPVKETSLSQPFLKGKQVKLTKIFRQSGDNPILNVLDDLRKHCVRKFKQIISENGILRIYDNWRIFVKEHCDKFKHAITQEDPSLIKLIAYTNKRIEAFNQVLRTVIFKDHEEYHKGEFLMGYDTCVYKNRPGRHELGMDIVNSEEYIVERFSRDLRAICGIPVSGYKLLLKPLNPEYFPDEIFIISREEPDEKFEQIAKEIEKLRVTALQAKPTYAGKYWKQYYQVMESFCTPYDLVLNGRVVRKKTLDYGYCISAHKSQGSQYQEVMIDMQNLMTCHNNEELRQLQYVAMSRTKSNVSLLM